MITGSSKVKILDVDMQRCYDLSIIEMWNQYWSSSMENDGNGGCFLDMLRRDRVYIQDLYGWSRVHRILKWEVYVPHDAMLYRVRYPDRELLIDYNGLLPVWNPNDPDFKFHGLIEYPYRLCNPDTLRSLEDQGWRMRMRNSEGGEFWHSLSVEPTTVPDVLYSIWTESGFYNVNGIQMFGSGNMDYSKIVVRKDFKIE